MVFLSVLQHTKEGSNSYRIYQTPRTDIVDGSVRVQRKLFSQVNEKTNSFIALNKWLELFKVQFNAEHVCKDIFEYDNE